jgi:hypothetical protein
MQAPWFPESEQIPRPVQSNQNHNRKKHGLQKVLEQSNQKLFGQKRAKGDKANNK